MRKNTPIPSASVETELLGYLGRAPELRETQASETTTLQTFRYRVQSGSDYVAEQHDTYTEERISYRTSRPWVLISLAVWNRDTRRDEWHRVISWTVPAGILRLKKGDLVRFLGRETQHELEDGTILRQFEVTNFRLERRRTVPEYP